MGKICFEHLALKVKDIDKTIKFYTEYFDFKVDMTDEIKRDDGVTKLALISLGDFVIEVVQPPVPVEGPVEGRFAHLCFRVDDVDAAYKDLKEKGLNFINEPKDMALFGGIRNVNLVGPDDEIIELLAK